MDAASFHALLQSDTKIASPGLCPELRLHMAASLPGLWHAQEAGLGRRGLATPYWGIAWPGGQALARYVLDNDSRFADRTVLDLGAGSGICAIAAARAGARNVEAADIDAFACQAVAANALLNDARVACLCEDVIDSPGRWQVVLAADLWYERFLAGRVTAWLRRLASEGTLVLLGDTGRAHFPRKDLLPLARYPVADFAGVEREARGMAGVWAMAQGKPLP